MQPSKNPVSSDPTNEVGETRNLADLAYLRARQVLETAVEESQRLQAEAAEEVRINREQALASLVESIRTLKRSAAAETAAMLDEAHKEADRLKEGARSEAMAPEVGSVLEDQRPLEAQESKVLEPVQNPVRKLRSWLTLFLVPVIGLSAFVLLIGNQVLPLRVVTVTSGSMEPAIPAGSLMLLQRVSADSIGIEDVITFHPSNRPEQLDTHRVVAVEEDESGFRQFVTQGDANPQPDAWRVPAEGTGWRHVTHVPYLGHVPELTRALPALAIQLKLPVLALGLAILIPLWLWPDRAQTA